MSIFRRWKPWRLRAQNQKPRMSSNCNRKGRGSTRLKASGPSAGLGLSMSCGGYFVEVLMIVLGEVRSLKLKCGFNLLPIPAAAGAAAASGSRFADEMSSRDRL